MHVLALFPPQPNAKSTRIWVVWENGNPWRKEGLEKAPSLHVHRAPSATGRDAGCGSWLLSETSSAEKWQGQREGSQPCPLLLPEIPLTPVIPFWLDIKDYTGTTPNHICFLF